MAPYKTLVALYFHCLTLGLAVSIPSPLQVLPVNDTNPSIIFPSGSSNLSEPTKPPGFEARLLFEGKTPLSPIETYINVIELMTIFSNLGWDKYIQQSMGISGDRFLTEACVFPKLSGTDETGLLPAKYAISGLYKAGVEIANSQRFQQLIIDLFVKDNRGHEHRHGYIELRPKILPSGLQSYHTVETNSVEDSNSNNSVAVPPKPRITDSLDKRFYITYDWNGHKLKSQDLFTAFLNALAIASVHDNADIKAFVPNAPAASGDVVLSTWSSGGPSADKLTWARVKRAIQLVWEDVVTGGGTKGKARFEDFEFELWYIPDGRGLVDGDKIGGGRVMKFGPDGPEGVYGGGFNGSDEMDGCCFDDRRLYSGNMDIENVDRALFTELPSARWN